MNPERDVHIARGALQRGVDDCIHVTALAIEQDQPDDVAPKLDLVEVALLAHPHPPHQPVAGPRTRIRRRDRALEGVVVECLVAGERQTANYALALLGGENGCRRADGDQQAGYDAQLT